MDDVDFVVLGGPHHGRKIVSHDYRLALPKPRQLPTSIPDGDAPVADIVDDRLLYQKAKFYDDGNHVYLVWIPQEVPRERWMRHVLECAAKVDPRLALFDQMREALKALELQALQSSVNRPSNEWGMEALGMTRSVLARIEAMEKGAQCAKCEGSGSWPRFTRQVCPDCHGS